mgnify:CR=1 FL=1
MKPTKQKTIKKNYIDNRFLSHTIVPLTGTNLPTGISDPADDYMTEEEFEAERERLEALQEKQSEL